MAFKAVDPDELGYVWHQVVRQVLEEIRAGNLLPGQRLPSIPGLAHEIDVAPQTVQRALAWLSERGVTVAYVGRGTYVAKPLPTPLPDPPDGRPLA